MARNGDNIISFDGTSSAPSLDGFPAPGRQNRPRLSRVSRSGRISPIDSPSRETSGARGRSARGGTSGEGRIGSVTSREAGSRRAARTADAPRSRINLDAFSAFDDLDRELGLIGHPGGAGAKPRTSGDRASAHASSGAPRAAVTAYDPTADEDDDQADERHAASSRASKRERKAKQKAKSKAAKLFERQFGGGDAAGAAGPRAAVYKGEMGKAHKRAFADLGGFSRTRETSSSTSRASTAAAASGTVPRRMAGPISAVIGAFVCIAVAIVFLYPTAQQYYTEVRTQAKLQAEYDALEARNAAIQGDIDRLSTDAGIEDAARQQLGWVEEGEVAGTVEGLDKEVVDSSAPDRVHAQVQSEDVATPQTWYSPVLDAVFGYSD